MTESDLHYRAKNAACGCGVRSRTEPKLEDGRKLDCLNEDTGACAEVELTRSRIQYDVEKLVYARATRQCAVPSLVVRPEDVQYARRIAAPKGVDVRSLADIELAAEMIACAQRSRQSRR